MRDARCKMKMKEMRDGGMKAMSRVEREAELKCRVSKDGHKNTRDQMVQQSLLTNLYARLRADSWPSLLVEVAS